MFKKLQKKLLLINMISILLIFIVSFITIYIMMYSNVRKEIQIQLNNEQTAMMTSTSEVRDGLETEIQENISTESKATWSSKTSKAIEFEIPFNIIINENNEIIKINSLLNMSKQQYQQLITLAVNNSKSEIITFEGRKWAYKILDLTTSKTGKERKITFMEVSSKINSLEVLLVIIVCISLGVIIIVYFVSLFFSKKAIEPVEEAWKKQKKFVEDASHDLKTPIASIKANLDVLLLNEEDNIKNQAKWINYIKIEILRMTKLVNNLLYLAKMESKDNSIKIEQINLSELLEETCNTMTALANEKNITITKNINANVIVKANEDILNKVINIVLDNACKYSNENGKIIVNLNQKNKKTILSIENTGKGIKKENLPYIFDRFYKEDTARTNYDNESYGLGLSIAKSAIEKINGKIIAESIPNEITKIIISL